MAWTTLAAAVLFFLLYNGLSIYGLRCQNWAETDGYRHELEPFYNYISYHQEGVRGYCDSNQDHNQYCLSLIAQGDIGVVGAKSANELPDVRASVRYLAYHSCDFGLVWKNRDFWHGYICERLERDNPCPHPYPHGGRCYHWNDVRSLEFGTPDIRSNPGQLLAGYQMNVVSGSMTIYCCRYGDECNHSRRGDQKTSCVTPSFNPFV